MATGGAPAASSAAVKARPRRGVTPRTRGSVQETRAPSRRAGSSPLGAERELGVADGGHRGEAARLRLPVAEVRRGDRDAPVRLGGVAALLVQRDEPLRRLERVGLEEHRVDDAEDGGVRGDAEA
jgi:hypothetical protein